jgi:hypothetical protein
MFYRFARAAFLTLSAFCLANCVYGQPGVSVVVGRVVFESKHGLIHLPPGVIGVRFDYTGLNRDSLMGHTLDLALITKSFIYLDSSSTHFSRATLASFRLGNVGFTDLLLKWKIADLNKVFKTWQEYDTVSVNWEGRPVITQDHSQTYFMDFDASVPNQSVIIGLKSLPAIIYAEEDGIARSQ